MEAIQLHPAPNETDQLRADIYALLAALFRGAPSTEMLQWMSELTPDDGHDNPMARAWSALALSARHTHGSPTAEYQDLFIGIGRGELMPFACWYLTGSLMEKPLAILRQDLSVLGFERQQEVYEPEDHFSALCEVMHLMIMEGRSYQQQMTFWQRHIEPWALRFCKDVQYARRAVFYTSVGLLGEAFMQQEADYFQQLSPADLTRSAAHNNNLGE